MQESTSADSLSFIHPFQSSGKISCPNIQAWSKWSSWVLSFLGVIFSPFLTTWQYHRIPISHQYSWAANHLLAPRVIRTWLVHILNPGLILFFFLSFFYNDVAFFLFLFLYLLKIQVKHASIIAIRNKVYGFLSPWET